MKSGKRPTRRQKIDIKLAGLIVENCLVERDTTTELVIINRFSGKPRTLRRGA